MDTFNVSLWLESVKEKRLAPLFRQSGFTTLEKVKNLTTSDLGRMGVTGLYAEDILGKLAQLNGKTDEEVMAEVAKRLVSL